MTIAVHNHSSQSAELRSFDKSRYLSAEVLDQEWDCIWRRSWLLAGLESDLTEPGDYLLFQPGREEILITRQPDGTLGAFYNVCQHRGNRLVRDERGHADSFRCAYHAWTYGLDGALNIVPHAQDFAQGVDTAARALQRVHVAVWDGMVFVCLAEHPQPLLEFLGPVVEHLAAYRFRDMVLVEDQTCHLACNWKAVVDNFSELYHVDFLHPQHRRMVDCCNDTVHLFDEGHTGLAVPGATINPRFPVPEAPTDLHVSQLRSLGLDPEAFRGRVLEIRPAVQQRKREAGRRMGYDYDAFTDDQLSDVWQYNLFPNIILSFSAEHCWIMRVRPHPTDPNQCEFDKLSLIRFADPALSSETAGVAGPGREPITATGQLPADYRRPERDQFDYDAIIRGEKTMTITIDQDIELLGDVQNGMQSTGFETVWLSEQEKRIQHFHQWWEQLMNTAGTGAHA